MEKYLCRKGGVQQNLCLPADLRAYFQYVEQDLDTAQLGGKDSKRLRNCYWQHFGAEFATFWCLNSSWNMVCN